MAKPFRQVVGENVRRLRDELGGLTQDDVAAAARSAGLTWGRSSVAAIERGTKALGVEEFALLPTILRRAWGAAHFEPKLTDGFVRAAKVSLADLTRSDEPVALTSRFTVSPERLEPMFGNAGALISVDPSSPVATDAERSAARDLGVTPKRLVNASQRLWGHSMVVERERRLRESWGTSDGDARRILRGHITRELKEELRRELRKRGGQRGERQAQA